MSYTTVTELLKQVVSTDPPTTTTCRLSSPGTLTNNQICIKQFVAWPAAGSRPAPGRGPLDGGGGGGAGEDACTLPGGRSAAAVLIWHFRSCSFMTQSCIWHV